MTQDLTGVFKISDDIIVHGRDTKEHDANLKVLLEKSREKNVTFNKAKCEFNKDRVVYYGLMFSKDGVSPAPCKVKKLSRRDALEMPRNLTHSSAQPDIVHDSWKPAGIRRLPANSVN